MKTINLLSVLFILTTLPVFAQHDAGTAHDKEGVVVFLESMPANQYRHLGTVQCSAVSPDKIEPMISHMIKQARKTHEEFDALIFRSNKGLCKADIVQYFRDPKAKRSRSRGRSDEVPTVKPEYKMSKLRMRKGTNLFIQNNPTDPYTLLGKVEIPTKFKSSNLESLMDEIVRVANEAYPDNDAVVVVGGTNVRKANVIKFK